VSSGQWAVGSGKWQRAKGRGQREIQKQELLTIKTLKAICVKQAVVKRQNTQWEAFTVKHRSSLLRICSLKPSAFCVKRFK
jgi:hypothetical protein